MYVCTQYWNSHIHLFTHALTVCMDAYTLAYTYSHIHLQYVWTHTLSHTLIHTCTYSMYGCIHSRIHLFTHTHTVCMDTCIYTNSYRHILYKSICTFWCLAKFLYLALSYICMQLLPPWWKKTSLQRMSFTILLPSPSREYCLNSSTTSPGRQLIDVLAFLHNMERLNMQRHWFVGVLIRYCAVSSVCTSAKI